jgi:hypothetical protein
MRERTPVQSAAMLVSIVFLLVGILGFIPGITTNFDDITFAGNESGAELLGIFQVSILHNIVHGLFGLVGLYLARTWEGARTYLIGGGVIYLVLFLYGIVISDGSGANFVPVNSPEDDILHVALGLGMIAAGYLLGRQRIAERPAI